MSARKWPAGAPVFEASNRSWFPSTVADWSLVVCVGFSTNSRWPLECLSVLGEYELLGLDEVKPLTPAAVAMLEIARGGKQ